MFTEFFNTVGVAPWNKPRKPMVRTIVQASGKKRLVYCCNCLGKLASWVILMDKFWQGTNATKASATPAPMPAMESRVRSCLTFNWCVKTSKQVNRTALRGKANTHQEGSPRYNTLTPWAAMLVRAQSNGLLKRPGCTCREFLMNSNG